MTHSSYTEEQVQYVTNFQDFIGASFSGAVNAICWSRQLTGDFAEILNKLTLRDNITEIEPADLMELQLTEQGKLARTVILSDLQLLKAQGAAPVLNVIKNYDRDDAYPFFPTDVYSFHVDRSPIPTDTILCTYYGACSEILPNAQARQKILIPDIRARLRQLYDGPDEGFDSFLAEHFFDLHYQPNPDAAVISLGTGNLWRLAVDHPGSKVAPCLHRAPEEPPGESRLLLIC